MPALAARAPDGATYAATGTGDARMSWTIRRIDVSSPPGVSSVSTTSCACASAARASPRCRYSAVAGPMTPVTCRATTGPGASATAVVQKKAATNAARNRATIAADRRAPRTGVPSALRARQRSLSPWARSPMTALRGGNAERRSTGCAPNSGFDGVARVGEVERGGERRLELAIASRRSRPAARCRPRSSDRSRSSRRPSRRR